MHFYRIESLGATFVSVSTLYHDKSIISIVFRRLSNILHSIHMRRFVFPYPFVSIIPIISITRIILTKSMPPILLRNTSGLYLVGQVGLEPTTALSTGFTVRGDTNYTVLTHMVWMERFELPTNCFVGRYSFRLSYVHILVEPAGIEPATPRFSVWRSTD